MSSDPQSQLQPLQSQDLRIFLGPRPGKKSMKMLADLKLTHCCTLLSEREDVRPIERLCRQLGCQWVWLPIEGGRLEVLQQVDLLGHMTALAQEIAGEQSPRVYFHCSAGIHRTGFFVYAMLRLRGMDRASAFDELTELRAVTAHQVGEDRLDLADQMLSN